LAPTTVLLAGPAVGQLAQDVQMSQVASGLLHQVHEHEAQRDGPATLVNHRVIHIETGGHRPGALARGQVEIHNLA